MAHNKFLDTLYILDMGSGEGYCKSIIHILAIYMYLTKIITTVKSRKVIVRALLIGFYVYVSDTKSNSLIIRSCDEPVAIQVTLILYRVTCKNYIDL